MKGASKFGNVHAVLVHESPECVSDLVANLRHLDPASTVLLYDGTGGQLELVSPDALTQIQDDDSRFAILMQLRGCGRKTPQSRA